MAADALPSDEALDQGSQTLVTWGPPMVESGSGWAVSNIQQKKGAQLTQTKLMIGLSLDHVGYVIADNTGHFIAVGGNQDILASFGFCRDSGHATQNWDCPGKTGTSGHPITSDKKACQATLQKCARAALTLYFDVK